MTTTLASAISKQLTSPIGADAKLATPIEVTYWSTFLSEKSVNTFTTWGSLMSYMAASVWNTAGDELKASLAEWFTESYVAIAAGSRTNYGWAHLFGRGSGSEMHVEYSMRPQPKAKLCDYKFGNCKRAAVGTVWEFDGPNYICGDCDGDAFALGRPKSIHYFE